MDNYADVKKKMETALGHGRAFMRRPFFQRSAFAVAFMVFFGGLAWSFQARPVLFQNINTPLFLLLIVFFCPLILSLNIIVFRITARITGVDFNWAEAGRLTVLSSALNHLPLPGGPVLRIAAMKERGADLLSASAVNLASAAIWMGLSFFYAGLWAIGIANILAMICIAAGAALVCLGGGMLWRVRRKAADILSLVAVNGALVCVYSLALWTGFQTVGLAVLFREAGVLSAAGVIGSAASFLPGGLGAREAAAAYLAKQISFDPFAGFAVTALVQIAMMIALAGLSAMLVFQKRAEMLSDKPVDNHF